MISKRPENFSSIPTPYSLPAETVWKWNPSFLTMSWTIKANDLMRQPWNYSESDCLSDIGSKPCIKRFWQAASLLRQLMRTLCSADHLQRVNTDIEQFVFYYSRRNERIYNFWKSRRDLDNTVHPLWPFVNYSIPQCFLNFFVPRRPKHVQRIIHATFLAGNLFPPFYFIVFTTSVLYLMFLYRCSSRLSVHPTCSWNRESSSNNFFKFSKI